MGPAAWDQPSKLGLREKGEAGGGLNASCGAEQDRQPPNAGIPRDGPDAHQEAACLTPVLGLETTAHSRVRQRHRWR